MPWAHASKVANPYQTQRAYGRYNDAVEQIHGDVHIWVGGSMGEVPAAAFDPIFWSHHAMIDKLWDQWHITIFRGFMWDLGSVPDIARGIVDNDSEPMRLATIPHDICFALQIGTMK